ncbi:MAG: hypothetical protein K8I27_09460 [Planctomycetes bacterium]|nr:hypothetical protein [Planctomycetota bacterium]
MLRLGALIVAVLLCSPVWGGLVDKHFSGKTETDVAAEFEAGMGKFLEARLKEDLKPRIWHDNGREHVWVEVIEVKQGESTWQTLVRDGRWYTELKRYVYVPYGKSYKLNTVELPPAEVASWYRSKYRLTEEMIALACWLAGKQDLLAANHVLTDLATHKTDLRADVEAWLCEKNAWAAPADGLQLIDTFDLERDRPGQLLLSKDAATEHYKALDKDAKKAFKELEKLQGGDVKSKPGYRRGQPAMRLLVLQDYVDNFDRKYAGTPYFEKKGNKEDIAAIQAAIKADIDWIEAEGFKAARLGIEDDWGGAAKAYDILLRSDPHNNELMQLTAEAFNKAAVVTDGARKAEDKEAARSAALIYDRLSADFPIVLAYHNHAGVNWLACGEAKKAKQHHEEVIRMTEDRKDLTENEQKNRDFAAGQLKLIG